MSTSISQFDEILINNSIRTSEDFIKALKSNISSSSSSSSSSKIQIATSALHYNSLGLTLPSKLDIISEWLITSLNKGLRENQKTSKSKKVNPSPSSSQSSHLDSESYRLLSLISSLTSESEYISLTSKLQVFQILSSVTSISSSSFFLASFSSAIEPILRFNAQKASTSTSNSFDLLQGCLGELVEALPRWLQAGEGGGQEEEGQVIVSSARLMNATVLPWAGSMESVGNARKATKFFLQTPSNLKNLLLSHHTITNHPTVSQSLSIQALESLKLSLQTILSFSAFSIEILLNYSNDWESLYQENQQSMIKGKGKEKEKDLESPEILDILQKILSSSQDSEELKISSLQILPTLLNLVNNRLSIKGFNLFSQRSEIEHGQPTFLNKQEISSTFRRIMLNKIVVPSLSLLLDNLASFRREGINSLERFLRDLNGLNLFIRSSSLKLEVLTWKASLTRCSNSMFETLKKDEKVESSCLRCFTSLWKLEEEAVKPLLKKMITEVVSKVSNGSSDFNDFFKLLVGNFSSARSLVELVGEVLKGSMEAVDSDAKGKLDSISVLQSSIFSFQSMMVLNKGINDFLTPNQVGEVLEMFRTEGQGLIHQLNGDSSSSNSVSKLIILLQLFSNIVPYLPLSSTILKDSRAEIKRFDKEVVDWCLRKGIDSEIKSLLPLALRVRTSMSQQQWFDEYQAQEEDRMDVDDIQGENSNNDEWLIKSLDQDWKVLLNLSTSDKKQKASTSTSNWRPEFKVEVLRAFFNRVEIANESFDEDSLVFLIPLLTSAISNLLAASLQDQQEVTEWNGKLHGLDSKNEGLAIWKLLTSNSKYFSLINTFGQDELLISISDFLISSFHFKSSSIEHSNSQSIFKISQRLARDAAFLECFRFRESLVQRIIFEETEELKNTQDGNVLPPQKVQKIRNHLISLSYFPIDYLSSQQALKVLNKVLRLDPLLSKSDFKKEFNEIEEDLKTRVRLRRFASQLINGVEFEASSPFKSSLTPQDLAHIITQVPNSDSEIESKQIRSSSLFLFEIYCRGLVNASKTSTDRDENLGILFKTLEILDTSQNHSTLEKGNKSSNMTSQGLAPEGRLRLVEILLNSIPSSSSEGFCQVAEALNKSKMASSFDQINASLSSLNAQMSDLLSTSTKDEKSLGLPFKSAIQSLSSVRISLRISSLGSGFSGFDQVETLLNHVTKFLETSCSVLISITSNQKKGLGQSIGIQLCKEILKLLSICGSWNQGGSASRGEETATQLLKGEASSSVKSSDGISLGISTSLGLAACLSVLDSFDSLPSLAPTFTNISSQLSIADYERTLDALLSVIIASSESGSIACASRDRTSVLKVYELLLRWGPEGTSKVARNSFSNFLGYSNQLAAFSSDPSAVLEVVDGVCSGKAMLLTPFDATRILSLLSVISGPSALNGKTLGEASASPSSIFSSLTSTLSSLTRLRRDLITPLLPQLTSLLSQLISLFRVPRPSLSKVQLLEVLSSYPSWMSTSLQETRSIKALTEEDARTLSRLLNGLVTKTTLSLSFDSLSSSKKQKKNHSKDSKASDSNLSSFSKPLSKHSSHILLSYIVSLTSSFTTIPTNVRTELLLGLFALCETIGEYERDSLMVGGLHGNEGGKVILRRIWKEWERGRYKGQ